MSDFTRPHLCRKLQFLSCYRPIAVLLYLYTHHRLLLIDDLLQSSITPVAPAVPTPLPTASPMLVQSNRPILDNKKAQLSLTNPRDAKACQKLLQFDELTTLSLTILAYLHVFSCCCVRNLRNPEKFNENSNLWSSRSSKVIDLGASRKPICDLLLVINSNFSRIC